MTAPAIVQQLIQYGYLPPGDYGTLDDSRVQEAIAHYREFLDLPLIDVETLFSLDRCGCPDIVPDAVGSGSWRAGCPSVSEWPNNHAAIYKVNKSRMPSYLNETFEESWVLMAKAYADVGLAIVRRDTGDTYNSLVTFEPGRGWIGLAIVGRNHTCGTRMWAKFDTRYGSSFARDRLVNQWAFLLAHELGHNCGLSHTRGGIMNPSLINGTFHADQWRRSDPAFSSHKRWYGGEPVASNPPEWSIPQPEQPRE
jgi:hypothetical protein